jgi:hypothetical protein
MTIREKIEVFLIEENYTFAQLANDVNMSEKELEDGLNDKTLPIKELELVSKITRVSLYSFVRDEDEQDYRTKRFYKNKL